MKKMEDIQNELQQKYMEMQYMEQHMNQYNQQLESIDSQLEEIDKLTEGLDTLDNKESGSELLVPVSNGIFAKAKLSEDRKLIMNVGAKVAVEKDTESAKELLRKQKSEIQKARIQITGIIESIAEQMQDSEKEIRELMKKVNKDV